MAGKGKGKVANDNGVEKKQLTGKDLVCNIICVVPYL